MRILSAVWVVGNRESVRHSGESDTVSMWGRRQYQKGYLICFALLLFEVWVSRFCNLMSDTAGGFLFFSISVEASRCHLLMHKIPGWLTIQFPTIVTASLPSLRIWLVHISFKNSIRIMHKLVESLHCIPETNVTVCVNCTQIKQKRTILGTGDAQLNFNTTA